MASLLVSLHEVVNNYIKKANDKEKAAKIGSEVLERSRQVAKKYLYTAEEACMFNVVEIYPMLSRELLHFIKIFNRRMKPSTKLCHPWEIRIIRNLPVEIFNMLEESILRGSYGTVVRKTKAVEKLEISTLDAATKWVKRVVRNITCAGEETDIFFKWFKDGSCCKAIISPDHSFVIKYSKTQENIQYIIRYGCWNTFGIPQHVL